jgi:hypothetical protein
MKKASHLLLSATLLLLILFLAAIPSQSVEADAGPHPSMQFVFISKVKPTPTIVSGQLYECKDEACTKSGLLPEMGPQRFQCQPNTCNSSGYMYTTYHRLEIVFSDGLTRQSNIFTKVAYFANYLVTIEDKSLVVEEKPLGPNIPFFRAGSPTLMSLIATVVFPCMEIVLPIILLVLATRTGRTGAAPASYAGWLIAAWILAVPATLAGIQWTQGLIITLAVELLLGLSYALWKKHSITVILTIILLMNLITQPILWITLSGFSGIYPILGMLFAEVVVVMLEAGVLYLSQRSSMKFIEALGISFGLNAASFVAGIFLPI